MLFWQNSHLNKNHTSDYSNGFVLESSTIEMRTTPHPRGNSLQKGMVTADGPCWKGNSPTWPRKRQAQIELYLFTAACRPGEWAAPGTFLARQSELGAEWSNTTSQSEQWKAGELQILMQGKDCPAPFELQLLPFHYWEGHSNPCDKKMFKAEFTAPLQNSMLDATKFILFNTWCLSLPIFSFKITEVLWGDFKKPAFHSTLWW